MGTARKAEGNDNDIADDDQPLEATIVADFLPRPEDLVLREEQVKVTLSLSRRSVEFFKEQAARHHTAYQPMIRQLLDAYAERFRRPEA